MTVHSRSCLAAILPVVVILGGGDREACGAPTLHQWMDQRGDVVIFGNTVGWDCRPGVPTPVVGTIPSSCNIDSTKLHALWRSEDNGEAMADPKLPPNMARSTAILELPGGASVTYARLYWAAGANPLGTPSKMISLERPQAISMIIREDSRGTIEGNPRVSYRQSSADVTSLVQQLGPGPYRVGNIDAAGPGMSNDFIVWSMVVFYTNADDPPRALILLDGFQRVDDVSPLSAKFENFLYVKTKVDTKLGIIAYGADEVITGDSLMFNDMILEDAQNPADNFFNNTRSFLGQPKSVIGDLPQLSGAPGSMVAVDLDVVRVPETYLPDMSTSATLKATTMKDSFYWGAFVSSIPTMAPAFTNTSLTYSNDFGGHFCINGLIDYTLTVRNNGNDTSTNTVVTNLLPQEVDFHMQSLMVNGELTAGYDDASHTIVVNLGNLQPNQSIEIKYKVLLKNEVQLNTIVSNQATIQATGLVSSQHGVQLPVVYSGDGNLPNHPTTFVADFCYIGGTGCMCGPGRHPDDLRSVTTVLLLLLSICLLWRCRLSR